MTEELKKQGIADDAAVAETVEETGATPGLDEAAKAAEREARRQALYEENERAEDERARAEAERMRDVDDEDEDETPRDTWATVRRLWSEAAGDHWRFYIVFASIVFYAIFNTAAPAYSARVIDELWGHMEGGVCQQHYLQHYLGELRQDHLHLLYDLDRRRLALRTPELFDVERCRASQPASTQPHRTKAQPSAACLL